MSKVLFSSLLILTLLGLVNGCSDDDPTGADLTLTGSFFINEGAEMAKTAD